MLCVISSGGDLRSAMERWVTKLPTLRYMFFADLAYIAATDQTHTPFDLGA
jgi:hypothetical protein